MGRSTYWPSLDGVRGVAIAAVVAFHLGLLGGGWLGVDVFFVLSGFLITSLLVDEHARRGRVSLGAFWGRRARRLLPALLFMLAVLALYAWAGGAGVVPAQLRAPAVATLLYFANWQQLASGHAYFSQFQATSPLLHTWSLSIEEQYYLVWPLLVLGLALACRRRAGRALVPVALTLAVASALWMGVAAHLYGTDRAYLGTDTRAWELLLGGIGAVWLHRAGPVRRRRAWAVATTVAAVVVAAGIAVSGGPPSWIWDGGLVAVAACALLVVVGAVRHEGGPVGRALSWGPLRGLGKISYSLYLWHWPVIVVLTAATTRLTGGPLAVVRVAAMLAAALFSYQVVEKPLRRADWSRWWRRALAPAALCGVVGLVLAATVPPVEASAGALRHAPVTEAAHSTVPPPVPVLPPGRVASPSDPIRVWILGDSVMADSAPGVTAALESTGDVQVVANSAFGGWGLSSDHNWASDSAQIIARYHPEVIIGTWSWDDIIAQLNPRAYLIKLVQALGDVLTPGDGVDLVALLQFPQSGPNPYATDPGTQHAAWASQDREQATWDEDARTAVEFFPGRAMYLPTQQLFAPDGRFMAWEKTATGAWIRARKIDDVHVCPYGAAELGALVADDLTPVLGLGPVATGWELGSWTRDAHYDDPPGACPDDQPPAGYQGVAVPGPPS